MARNDRDTTHEFNYPLTESQVEHLKQSAIGLHVRVDVKPVQNDNGKLLVTLKGASPTVIEWLVYDLERLIAKQERLHQTTMEPKSVSKRPLTPEA